MNRKQRRQKSPSDPKFTKRTSSKKDILLSRKKERIARKVVRQNG